MIGGGGHASVLTDILRSQKRKIVAVVCPDNPSNRSVFAGIPHFSNDDDVLQFSPEKVLLVNGIGVLPNSSIKRKLNQYYLSYGYQFETVVADSAEISSYAQISAGSQVFPGVIIQTGVRIGSHCVINTGAVIEHDCCIGEYNHIAPNATVCGQVKTHLGVFIGASSIVFQNVELSEYAIVGAGSILAKNLKCREVCFPFRSKIKKG